MDAADRSYWKGNKRAPKRDGVLDVVSSAFNPALNASSWAACVEALRTITIPAVRAMAERAAKAESSFSDFAKWIPVSERTPAIRAFVLAWETAGALHCTVAQYRGTPGWFGPWDEKIEITHWMPLPEAPK